MSKKPKESKKLSPVPHENPQSPLPFHPTPFIRDFSALRFYTLRFRRVLIPFYCKYMIRRPKNRAHPIAIECAFPEHIIPILRPLPFARLLIGIVIHGFAILVARSLRTDMTTGKSRLGARIWVAIVAKDGGGGERGEQVMVESGGAATGEMRRSVLLLPARETDANGCLSQLAKAVIEVLYRGILPPGVEDYVLADVSYSLVFLL
ncbi:hypothetical protein B0H14DRAFT_3442933 [Mycena olivaceomarginata]|nr:hypothetical protein B0H14DRAFT_3442933 [Mycena olivaceomarginata]